MEKVYIEQRAVELARYIITTKDTVRGAARKFGVSKSTVHMEVTLKNGWNNGHVVLESITIKNVFLAERNPVVKLRFIVK